MPKAFNLYKVVVNKATNKVETRLGWFAVRTHANSAAKAAKLTSFGVSNLSKCVKLGMISEGEAKELKRQKCNGGKGLPMRSYQKLVNDPNVKPGEKALLKGENTVEPKPKSKPKTDPKTKTKTKTKTKGKVDDSLV